MTKIEKLGKIIFKIEKIQEGIRGEFVSENGDKQEVTLNEEEVKAYFTDGRRVSFIIERYVAKIFNGELAGSEKAGYDIILNRNEKWEVRSVTERGTYFTPSNQVGKGRDFNKEGFMRKLQDIRGYILADVTKFPEVPIYKVPSEVVQKWWEEGKLGKKANVSYQRIIKLLEEKEETPSKPLE